MSTVACAFSLLLTGCDLSGSTPTRQSADKGPTSTGYAAKEDDFAAIRLLLTDRARALTKEDRAAFMATVDHANAGFVARQRTYYANLQALPVTTVRYESTDYALTPATVSGSDPVLRPEVTEHVFLPGTDAKPVANEIGYTFVQREGQWLLGAEQVAPFRYLRTGAESRPWVGRDIAVEVRGHLVVVTDRSDRTLIDDLATAASADIARVSRLLRQPADTRVLVDATSSGSAMSLNSNGNGDAAAITYPVLAQRASGAAAVAGWRIKVNPRRTLELMLDPVLLRHEITHYVLRRINVRTPTWLVEGAAEVSAYWPTRLSDLRVSAAFYRGIMAAPRELPVSAEWTNDPAVNYVIGHAAVDYLWQTYGVERLVDLMRAYSRREGYTADGDSHTRELLRKMYGTTEAQVVNGAFRLLSQSQH